MPNYSALIAQNNKLWATAEYHDAMMATAKAVALRICTPRAVAVYKELERVTTVPWWVIGVIHYREANLSWGRNIAQGDPWNSVSRHVPKGRGPFKSFYAAAVDALTKCAPFAARWKDWSPGGALTLLELYNGTGYEHHGVPSPYVWSGTQHYRRGKYVKDGPAGWDPNVVDKQLGCAILLHCMQENDQSVMGGGGPNPDEYPDPNVPLPTPRPNDIPASAADDPPPSITDRASDVVEDNPDAVDKIKSLIKSKIAWLQGGATVGGIGAAGSSDDSTWAALESLLHKPMFWCVLVMLVCVGLTIFFRWYDHGRGAKK